MVRQSNNDNVFIKITNRDIYDKLEDMHNVQCDILTQAKITNGRMTRAECDIVELRKTSWGMVAKISGLSATLAIIVTIVLTLLL